MKVEREVLSRILLPLLFNFFKRSDMKTILPSVAGICILFFILGCNPSLNSQSKYKKLVWSEEFNYKGLPDSTKWSYDKGNGCPDVCGWGNNELQYYTWNRTENARVEDGHDEDIVDIRRANRVDLAADDGFAVELEHRLKVAHLPWFAGCKDDCGRAHDSSSSVRLCWRYC